MELNNNFDIVVAILGDNDIEEELNNFDKYFYQTAKEVLNGWLCANMRLEEFSHRIDAGCMLVVAI